jgi:hypothetical protein
VNKNNTIFRTDKLFFLELVQNLLELEKKKEYYSWWVIDKIKKNVDANFDELEKLKTSFDGTYTHDERVLLLSRRNQFSKNIFIDTIATSQNEDSITPNFDKDILLENSSNFNHSWTNILFSTYIFSVYHYMAAQLFRHKGKYFAVFRDPGGNEEDFRKASLNAFSFHIQSRLKAPVYVFNVRGDKDTILTQKSVGVCGIYSLTFLRNDGLLDRMREELLAELPEDYLNTISPVDGIHSFVDPERMFLDIELLGGMENFIQMLVLKGTSVINTQRFLLDMLGEKSNTLFPQLKISLRHQQHAYTTNDLDISLSLATPKNLELLLGFNQGDTFDTSKSWHLATTQWLLSFMGKYQWHPLEIDGGINYVYQIQLMNSNDIANLYLQQLPMLPFVYFSSSMPTYWHHHLHQGSIFGGLGLNLKFSKFAVKPKVYIIHIINDLLKFFIYSDYISLKGTFTYDLTEKFQLGLSSQYDHLMTTNNFYRKLRCGLGNRISTAVTIRYGEVFQGQLDYHRETLEDTTSGKLTSYSGFGVSIKLLLEV